jgi:hypothetical protein
VNFGFFCRIPWTVIQIPHTCLKLEADRYVLQVKHPQRSVGHVPRELSRAAVYPLNLYYGGIVQAIGNGS